MPQASAPSLIYQALPRFEGGGLTQRTNIVWQSTSNGIVQSLFPVAMKVMASGLKGGTSFMEDYTYDLKNAGMVLGAHMLEICPSIADGRPSLEIHPLSIGGKADPVRLVFDAGRGPAVNASIVDMGDRFRMIVNQVGTVAPEHPLRKLPVARAVWVPEPNLKVAAGAWILAGGAHHTGFSLALTAQHLEDFASIADMEFLLIDAKTTISEFKKELRWNDLYYRLIAFGNQFPL